MSPVVTMQDYKNKSQNNNTQDEDIKDDSDEEGNIDIEDCNVVINDDDNGSYIPPMSNNDI